MPPPADRDRSPRILLIRPSALGDVCRSVPVLASLRARFPAARIDWLVQDSFADAVRAHPMLDGVVRFPRGRLGRAGKRWNVLPSVVWMDAHLAGRYDVVIDAQGLLRSGILARWTGARVRVGYRHAAEGASLLFTRRVTAPPAWHAVDRMLTLPAALGAAAVRDMRLYTPADCREEPAPVAALWSSVGASGAAAPVVLAPTSRWPSKRWPAERWAELARRLLGRGAGAIAVVGGPGERAQCGPLLAMAEGDRRVVDLVGRTSVGGLMGVIERSRLVVCNDSAAAHMAVGFERPLVCLFGPTDVTRTGPYGREGDVIQRLLPGERPRHKRPDGVRLMERIGVEEVLRACLDRL